MKSHLKNIANWLLKPLKIKLVKDLPLVYVHSYKSYEEYARSQIFHNKRKLDQIWADDDTLTAVADYVIGNSTKNCPEIFGICHGSRNGYEVGKLKKLIEADSLIEKSNIIGTDISDTALQFDNMIQWDFHNENPNFTGKADFIYSNSLDQSWKPFQALQTWLGQLKESGVLIIEHTQAHGVADASEMDPFGVLPEYMPYVLAEHFGHKITIQIIKTTKANNQMECWLFVLKKTSEWKQ